MSPRIAIDERRIAAFCAKWKISKLELFGSVLRDDFRPDSDVDLLVTYAPEVTPDLRQLTEIEEELREILGRDIDLVERRAVEKSDNYIRRREILGAAEALYAAG
ncbi:MAG: nucleotidyltransferase domain-containing protein [Thermoanaerobaculia bacterium]